MQKLTFEVKFFTEILSMSACKCIHFQGWFASSGQLNITFTSVVASVAIVLESENNGYTCKLH